MDDNDQNDEQFSDYVEDPAVLSASENPDPTQAVDGMLDAALRQDKDLLSSEELATTPENLTYSSNEIFPIFSIIVPYIDENIRPHLLKSFELCSFGCDLEDLKNQVNLGCIHLSKLSEYQAAALAQELRRYSIKIEAHRHWDHENRNDKSAENPLTEEEESSLLLTEGAPSVVLPAASHDVLLVTLPELPNYKMHQTMGLVYAHKSLARKFFRNQESQELLKKELKKINKENAFNAILPQSAVEKTFRALFSELRKAALTLGGNAVVDIRIECFSENSSLDPDMEQMRMVLSGTASLLEKITL